MSHILKLISKSAYEPFNDLDGINEYNPPKVSLFRVTAHYLDLRHPEGQRESYTAERRRNGFPEQQQVEYRKALATAERESTPYFNSMNDEELQGRSSFSLRFDFEYGREDLDEKYCDIPYKEIFADAMKIRDRIAHQHGMRADMDFDPGSMPVYGTIVNTTKMPKGKALDTDFMIGQMKDLGINAYIAGINGDQIFVPNYRVGLVNDNPDLPYAESDPQSRTLLLAYLTHHNLLDQSDKEDIEKTFSLRDREQAATIDLSERLAGLAFQDGGELPYPREEL